MSLGRIMFDTELVKKIMGTFWRENLVLTPCGDTVAVAYPLLMPDGLQLVFHMKFLAEKKLLLTDKGKTYSWLESQGLTLNVGSNKEEFAEKALFYDACLSGASLEKIIEYPPDPVDIQLYAEGLLAIAHLVNRREQRHCKPPEAKMAITRILKANHINYQTRFLLNAGYNRKLKVDFYSKEKNRAIQTINRKNEPNTQLEIWAYRAEEITRANAHLQMALVYDEDRLALPSDLERLVHRHCPHLFPSSETEAIEAFLVA